MGKDYVEKSDLKKLNIDVIPWRFRIIYTTLFYTGMRPGEILELTPADFHKEHHEEKNKDYYFIDMKTQKNQEKNELTPIRQQDYIAIMDFVRQNKIGQRQYIFGSSKNNYSKPMSVSWLNRKLKGNKKDNIIGHLEMAGIKKDITGQSFRAGLVTYLREEKGLSYGEISTITRHQNIRIMIKHYDKRIKHNAFDIIEQM